MPTYSYRCTQCGEAFDIQQAFTDDTLTVCPNCGGKLRKLFNTVGVTFNGSGFYRNDSRPPAPAGDSGSSDSSGSSESSSAPAAKPESSSASSSSGSAPSPSGPTASPTKKE